MPDSLPSKLLKKMGVVPEEARIQAAYKKGCDEGLVQGYQQAKGEFEGKIQELQSQMERRFKVDEDQINLLGRLVDQLSKDQTGMSQDTKETLEKILKILEEESRVLRKSS